MIAAGRGGRAASGGREARHGPRRHDLARHRPHPVPGDVPRPARPSLAGRALANGIWSLDTHDIRDAGLGRHRSVDDTPFGGGAGMVMRPDVVDARHRRSGDGARCSISPRAAARSARPMRPPRRGPGAILLCGRYEGVDQRVIDARGAEEVSIGDYVLSGGELAAMVVLDACVRLLPGVMGAAESAVEESFSAGLLEYPHYTRPAEWQGRAVPGVLLSGDHAAIARWRQAQARRPRAARRPDLLARTVASGVTAP